MLTLLIFIIGITLGLVLSTLHSNRYTGNGYFSIEPYDEDDTGFYCVNMRIPPEEQAELMNKERLVLHREHSQK